LQARLAAQPVDAWEPGPARPPGPVLRALAALSERDREVLLLIAWDGLAHDEAAAVCGCSRPALRVRLHRARRRFASELARARAGDAPEVTHPMEAREDTVP
jgi:RNA polymerase sigma-70 factor (ECF subfamily)